ncbi:cytochrome P450 71A9-like [Selaginella moellendorffii]|uniref:cytochrome P450 71A9-like n=1 Tax=Selaginella moellendorffii TaxID=88036 RepID=UPI000D1CEF1F|nr:cytochrome P450 71A9-like [Selaginella moellendorffii]|eukprot:XP_024540252.1 cytochrome P450 71A9-like [Selaginella moellendorffii]
MAKAQDEIDLIFGGREVNEDKLKYLKAAVKETFHLHPPASLMAPHESLQDCEVNGFTIPAKTRVLINIRSIARDPRWWGESAGIFNPERYGKHFELLWIREKNVSRDELGTDNGGNHSG